jgi:hypothetical protein
MHNALVPHLEDVVLVLPPRPDGAGGTAAQVLAGITHDPPGFPTFLNSRACSYQQPTTNKIAEKGFVMQDGIAPS